MDHGTASEGTCRAMRMDFLEKQCSFPVLRGMTWSDVPDLQYEPVVNNVRTMFLSIRTRVVFRGQHEPLSSHLNVVTQPITHVLLCDRKPNCHVPRSRIC